MQTLVTIDDEQLEDLMLYTHAQNESEAILKAIQSYLQQNRPKTEKQYSFIGIANSGKGNFSEQADEILATGANREEGWSLFE